MSQSQLARLSGVSRSHVCRIESGHRMPTLGLLESFADSMQVPVVLLVYLASEVADLRCMTKVDRRRLSKVAASYQRMDHGSNGE